MKKKTKKILIFGGSAVLIIGIGSFFVFGKDSASEYVTEKAEKGTVAKTVSVTGSLLSENEINLNFETAGRINDIRVGVGDKVAKSEVLAVINSNILSKEVDKARLAMEKAAADSDANDDVVREAKQAVEDAEEYLDEVDDLYDQKILAAEQDYDNADDYYDDVLDYYNKIVEDNGESSSEAKYARITLTSASNSKKAAEEALETAKKTEDMQVVSAENALNTAKEKLKTARSQYAKTSRDATVQTARRSYEIALANLEKATLKAPVNGTITKVNYKKSEVLGTSAAVSEFGKIISEDFILESDIPESDIVDVRVGQKADIVFDSLPSDEKFTAEVIEIEPASTVIQDVIYYKVKLRLESVDARLKEGMSADIDIMTAEEKNVLMIPERAVEEDNGEKKVKVMEDGKVKTVKVKTGLSGDEGMIEITSGLKEGEEVVTLEKKKE